MSWIDRGRDRLRRWFRRGAEERAIADEFAFHVERETQKNLDAGLDPAEARRAAQLSFGPSERFREEVRDTWTPLLDGVGADVRWGLRRLRGHAGFTATAVLTLGLGIGASTAIYTLVRSVLMQPLPYEAPNELVMLWRDSADLADDTWFSLREVVEYRRATTSFTNIAASTDAPVTIAEGEPERVQAAWVTANFFATLGVRASLGRAFEPGDDAAALEGRVLLSHRIWQRQFGGASDIVGRSIRVSGRPRTVVGVLPADFRMPLDYREERPTELFWSSIPTPRQLEAWGDRSYFIVARRAAGATPASIAADMDRAHRVWVSEVAELSDDNLSERAALPVAGLVLGDVRRALYLLFGAVGLLLLVACANVAHLLLARGDARRREIATQAVLGASRARLVRQLLIENGLLAMAGGIAGVALAYGIVATVLSFAPVNAIRMRGVVLDAGVLGFSCLIALGATLAAGLLPALRLSRTGAADALSGARGEGASIRRGTRRLLVAAEMALSLVLVLCAALLARSYAELRRVDLGFDPSHVLAVRLDLASADYPNAADVIRFHRNAVARVAAVPGVLSAGSIRVLPLTSTIGDWSITLEHRERRPTENPNGDWQVVTPGYFETMRIAVRRGRAIEGQDHETAPLVAVVNETMAERYWPGEDAIGKRFHLGTGDTPWIEIVGVSADVHHNTIVEHSRAEMYVPHAQWPRAQRGSARLGMTLVARTSADPAALLPRVRDEIRSLDKRVPVSDTRTLDAVTSAALAGPRFTTMVLAAFALLALLLAAVGLYGVVSFVAARRTREIGVRMALGARAVDVGVLIIRDGVATSAAGVAVGLVASIAATGLLSSQLYGISRLDPSTFILAPLTLLVVAALASYLPARRAVRINPVTALRQD